jgi:Icc-related predicted phosphoesterase
MNGNGAKRIADPAASTGPRDPDTLHVAAIGDVHCNPACQGKLHALFERIAESANVMVLCGDLTDHGLPEEAQSLVKELVPVARLPVLAVLGNHDYESGKIDEIRKILTDAGVILMDGDAREIQGVGFAGVKGFGGGFGRGTLGAFGEPAIKHFVKETLNEVMKLESALSRLSTPHKLVMMHYSPVRDTLEGEPPEIFPFLGSSRLEEPLNRFGVTAVVHGHAHKGAAEGKTSTGIPVYNVSMPVMRTNYPDRPPFRLLNLPIGKQLTQEQKLPASTPVETNIA